MILYPCPDEPRNAAAPTIAGAAGSEAMIVRAIAFSLPNGLHGGHDSARAGQGFGMPSVGKVTTIAADASDI